MSRPDPWLIAIVLGSMLNFMLFFSLTLLSRKPILEMPKIMTLQFHAWQEPVKVKRKVPVRQQTDTRRPKRTKPVKQPLNHSEMSLAEPAERTPAPQIPEPETPSEEREAPMPVPVPIFQVSSLPRFVHRSEPNYPPEMLQQGREGVVLLEALVDSRGGVRKVTVIESAGAEFDQAAVAAIRASTFIPANTNGKPVPVLLRVPVRFRLR